MKIETVPLQHVGFALAKTEHQAEHKCLKLFRAIRAKLSNRVAEQSPGIDAGAIRSNTFSMEWPKGSAKTKSFPEIDKADWFDLETAKVKILKGQLGLLEQLAKNLPQRNR